MGHIDIVSLSNGNIRDYGVCGYTNIKRPGYGEKLDWISQRFKQGLKIKTLVHDIGGNQGMIETIPAEYGWRPIEADGFLLVHCLFVGFRKEYKGRGYGALLIRDSIDEAKRENRPGVCVVTRKGSFMAGPDIFLKLGFEPVDQTAPDFQLLVKKFDSKAPTPAFKKNLRERAGLYPGELTIIRSFQCPYSVKNVNEICREAENTYHVTPKVITLTSHEQAQNEVPCAVGNFCIIYKGRIVAEHPISRGRFVNILKKEIRSGT